MRGRKPPKRVRVVRWWYDEKGQRVETWRKLKGECHYCGWPAYRWATTPADGKILVCQRDHMRVTRNKTGRNTWRQLRQSDVEHGQALIAEAREARRGITCTSVWRAINLLREADGLKSVKYPVVLRKVCLQCESFQGYEQDE